MGTHVLNVFKTDQNPPLNCIDTGWRLFFMYDENDYIMKQIKSMVRGLGKFMGLEQIKELLQLSDDQQGTITDLELETIIVISKLEIIIANKEISIDELSDELMIDYERLNMLIANQIAATQKELDKLNNYIENNEQHLN